jgi:hypothetical protein
LPGDDRLGFQCGSTAAIDNSYGVAMELRTPWLRDQLRSHLLHLADAQWLDEVVSCADGGGEALDQVLDFLDDTGVADEPAGRIGYLLYDEREAEAMRRLGRALDGALGGRVADQWRSVSAAARRALDTLG